MAAPVILVEGSPRRVADGVVEAVRLAGAGGVKPYRYPDAAGGADRSWRGGIVSLPTIICSLTFDGTDLGTGGVPQATEILWSPARSSDLDPLAAYFWFDAGIAVRIGPEADSPPVVLAGKVLGASISGGQLKLSLADPAAKLKKPFPLARYAGTGDLEGPVEWAGRLKPRIWGKVWNQPGEPLDKANNIYSFADPTRPLQAIDAVRDRGAAAAALTTLAWQGSAAATLAALRAAAAPEGGGVRCPSLACVKWWTEPGGLNADLRGEIAGGYTETAAGIAGALVASQAGVPFEAGALAAAAAARPDAIGWVVDDDTTTVAAMLDELLGNVSLLWLLSPAGEIVIREWAWGASVASARSHEVTRLEQFRPVHTRRIGYQRNEQPMARGDIAAIVLASNAIYADGTPVEDLKPAEGGATVGAPNGTPVADRPAEQLVDQVDAAADAVADALGRTTVLETQTIPAIDDAIAEADGRITDARARADAARTRADDAFTEIDSEAARLDQRIDSVAASGGYDDTAIYAEVSRVEQAYVAADLAFAERASDIEASVDDAEARIGATETAVTDGRFAAASRATALEAQMAGTADSNLRARIMATETAVTDGRFATAQRATEIETAVDNAEARIATVETATTDGRFAAALRVDELEVEYDGTAAKVTEHVAAIAGLNTRTAAYVKTVAVAGNNRAQLTLYADANAGAGVDIVGDVAIQGDLVVSGTITTPKIADQAVTQNVAASGGFDTVSNGQTKVVQTLTATASGAGIVRIDAQFAGRVSGQGSSGTARVSMRRVQGGNSVDVGPNYVNLGLGSSLLPTAFWFLDTPAAGSVQYELVASADSGDRVFLVSGVQLVFSEFKK